MSFNLNNFFQFLVPKDKKFYPLFEEASMNLISLAETLHEGVNAPRAERDPYLKKIEELEAVIEEITHKTHLELNKNFITPFDREDIHALVKSMDDVPIICMVPRAACVCIRWRRLRNPFASLLK